MTSYERVKAALEHRESDRIPFDLGGSVLTGINRHAYVKLRRYLGLPEREVDLVDPMQQLARVDADLLARLEVDVACVDPDPPAGPSLAKDPVREGGYWRMMDEWGISWKMPVESGHYFNPVQVSAAGMDTKVLKREFGKDLTFWGGGVDSQRVLPFGAPAEVRDEARRRIDDLAPGGGFVFASVHNVQSDVSPENFMAMREAMRDFGAYR
jgi:hypothetical protein